MIRVHQLSKRFGSRWALKDLDLEISKGQCVALLGANGAGKSTLLRILSTLSRPTRGEAWVNDLSVKEQPSAVRACIGLVSHQPMLYGELTAGENLRFYSHLYSISQVEKKVANLLEWIGLNDHLDIPVYSYSRGMQQRLALARALVHDPEVLLLDEPYAGLDEPACDLLDELLRQVTAQGRTVIVTTHELEHVEHLADRFVILAYGSIIASSTYSQLPSGGARAFYRDSISVRQEGL